MKKKLLTMLLCIALAGLRLEGAEILDPAVTVSRIDLAATQSIRGNGVDATTLSALLDVQGAGSRWKAAAPADAKAGPFHHRLAFKQAVELGAFLNPDTLAV